jgi:hypothetical protein
VLGFYAAEATRRRVNLTNVLQLEMEFPHQVKLAPYSVSRAHHRATCTVAARVGHALTAPGAVPRATCGHPQRRPAVADVMTCLHTMTAAIHWMRDFASTTDATEVDDGPCRSEMRSLPRWRSTDG